MVDPVNTWCGTIGLVPDGTLIREISPFGGTWMLGVDGKLLLGQNVFSSIYTQPDGRVIFASTLNLRQ